MKVGESRVSIFKNIYFLSRKLKRIMRGVYINDVIPINVPEPWLKSLRLMKFPLNKNKAIRKYIENMVVLSIKYISSQKVLYYIKRL